MIKFVIAFLLQLIILTRAQFVNDDLASEEDLARFKTSKWLNPDEVASSVNFFNHTRNPYPNHLRGYNVDIDHSMSCYVVFEDAEKKTYNMVTAKQNPDKDHPHGSFFSHKGPCGVCSNLQDLGVFIEKRDLTAPVRKCAMMLRGASKRQCILNLGFTERCMWIWYWNTIHTRLGCLNVCLRHIRTVNNQPVGNYNPCKPVEGHLPNLEEDHDDELVSPNPDEPSMDTVATVPAYSSAQEKKRLNPLASTLSGLSTGASTQLARVAAAGNALAGKSGRFKTFRKSKPAGCRTSINNGPACDKVQYENGPHRLNPCLQCDECKSGPMFKKVSGRTRRNSGIKSAIERPGVPIVDHHYFTGSDEFDRSELGL